MAFLRAVKFWIYISALASVAGWFLSAIGMLNISGYVLFVLVIAFPFLLRQWISSSPSFPASTFKKLRARFQRFLPAAFGILAALIFLSGLLYEPNDHTGLSYRVPRVLQWLQHGSWFWIHTPNYRMNDRACGIEWLSAPLLLFMRSDRALFLLNFIPFILMPGLIFSIWTRLGVRARVAWNWMWLLPTGYCFLLQAGGIANDAFPTLYGLAMIDFALRAWEKVLRWGETPGESQVTQAAEAGSRGRSPHLLRQMKDRGLWTADYGLSLISAALLVGAKASNLPLGLPWILLMAPLLPRLRSAARTQFRIGVLTPLLFFIAVVISFAPTAILNIHYLHDWSGLSIEHTGMNMRNPIAGILGNAVLLVTNNFVPTFFPMAHWWNEHALSYFPGALVRLMNANFEGGYNILGEMPIEDAAGIGFGISVLVVVSVVAGFFHRGNTQHATRNTTRVSIPPILLRAVLIAPWIALLAYSAKTGMVTPARLIAPYYPLLFPALLIGAGQSQLVRRCWWRVLAGGVLLLALAALILMPSRPLWPAETILAKALAAHPNQPQLLRAQKVYEVYGSRADPLAAIRDWFPPRLEVVGFMGTQDDLDISLWKPYGSRRVEPFLFEDSSETIRKLGIQYAIVSGLELEVKHSNIQDWLQKTGAELLNTTNAVMTVSQGPEPWYFVRVRP